MLLKNTGDKIINIGRDILMPGEEKPYPDGLLEGGALRTLISMGFLKASRVEAKKPAKSAEAAEIPVNMPDTGKEPAKRTSRQKASKQSEG